jgi:predicted DNA-binding protein YlxM (UPF0122 family)
MSLVGLLVFENSYEFSNELVSTGPKDSNSENTQEWIRICEVYQLPQSKLINFLSPWLTEQNRFKKLAREIGAELLTTVVPREHTIIRSETFERHTIHVLVHNKYGFIAVMTEATKNVHALPVHIVFKALFDADRDTITDQVRLQRLVDRINIDLENYYKNLVPFDEINRELEATKVLMRDNIDKVVKNTESLEQLLEKTEKLSVAAQEFKTRSKRMNRCCYFL